MAVLADVLTVSRIPLAVLLGASVASNRLDLAVLIVGMAWLTDSLDGSLARAAARPTRLGEWDFRIDMGLCVGILAGLAGGGRGSVWLVALVVIGMVPTLITGNPAPAMLAMGVTYAWFLVIVYVERQAGWWLPFIAIAGLLALEWRRFVRVILPAFFKGVGTVRRGRAADTSPVLDEWA